MHLPTIGKNCPDLRTIELAKLVYLSDRGFKNLVKGCKKLENMDLEECQSITNSTLIQMSLHCPNLQSLTLSNCERIDDDGIRYLCGSGLSQLRELELDNCKLISDVSLDHVYQCRSLQKVDLYDCLRITRRGIVTLAQRKPALEIHVYFPPDTPPALQNEPVHQRVCKCCEIL
eukprot:sb/3472053/